MTLSTFTYAKHPKSYGIAKFSNKIIKWKATCSKQHLHEKGWSSTKKQISQCRNLHQDLHKTATSLIHRINCQAAPFISEHSEQRLHTDTLYMQDKSSKMKILIYTYWKLDEPWQFKQLQNTAPQGLIDGANIWMATWLYNIVLSENLASRSSIVTSLNSKRSSFKTRGSSLELWWSSLMYLWAVLYISTQRKNLAILL